MTVNYLNMVQGGRENSRRKLESGGVCMPYLRFLRDAANSDGGGRDYRVLVLSFDPQDTHRRKWQRNLLGDGIFGGVRLAIRTTSVTSDRKGAGNLCLIRKSL